MASVSVILTVYNTAKYLDKCMKSVMGQTFRDLEIILVDDGSTDGVSPVMCDDYADRDSRVRVIHKENGGLISAWMRGVEESSSQYVFFVDSDDWIDTDMIEKYYAHVDSSFADSEIIAGNCIMEKAREKRKIAHGLKPGVYTGPALDEVRLKVQGEEQRPVTMSRCMKLISRKLVLDNMKYCDKRIVMGEDANITIPCLCDCRRLVILEGTYSYHYRLLTGSMAHAYNPKLLDNLYLTDRTFRGILKEKKIANADQQMDREFVQILLMVLKNELRAPKHGTVNRVKRIFLRDEIRNKVLNTQVSITGKSNRLIYYTARHPNFFTVSFSKALISIFDRLTN